MVQDINRYSRSLLTHHMGRSFIENMYIHPSDYNAQYAANHVATHSRGLSDRAYLISLITNPYPIQKNAGSSNGHCVCISSKDNILRGGLSPLALQDEVHLIGTLLPRNVHVYLLRRVVHLHGKCESLFRIKL